MFLKQPLRMKPGLLVPLAVIALPMLGGCTVGPNVRQPHANVRAQFAAATQPATTQQAATQENVDLRRWWESLHDPALNELIDQALQSNLDVRLASARVREARAQWEFNRAGLFPTADATGQYSRNRFSHNVFGGAASQSGGGGGAAGGGSVGTPFTLGESDLYRAGFDAGWEIDVFGGTRRAIEAAQYSLESQMEARRNALVTLLSEVAQNYVMLRGFQHELRVVRDNVAAQRATLNLQRIKLQAGLTNQLTITQASAQVATTESQIPTLETQIEQTIQRLGVLLDRDPEALRAKLSDDGQLPSGPASVPPGLPSELLRRRPDVRQAERQFAAATAEIGVAMADLFPKFNLTGSLGLESLQLKTFFNSSSIFYSFGPSVSWRIFDAGQIWANVRIQNARQEEALIQYRQAVIQSMADVENALVAYNREQARSASLRQSVESNRQSVALAKQLNEAGVVDFLNVLTAQLALYQSEDQLAQSEQTVLTDLIALYKALGGGWETTEQAADAQPREIDESK